MNAEVSELYAHVLENVPGLREQIRLAHELNNEYYRNWRRSRKVAHIRKDATMRHNKKIQGVE